MPPSSQHLPASVRRRLLSEQIDLLAKQIPALAIGGSCLAVGAAYILLHRNFPMFEVAVWVGILLALSAVRVGVYGVYRRRIRTDDAKLWAKILATFSALSGIVWGSLGIVFFTPNDPFSLALVSIILASILASALNSTAAYWPAHLAFAVPCAAPFALRCLIESAPPIRILGALAAFYLVFSEVFARSMAQSIRDSLLLRFENAELVERLQEAKIRAEEANRAKSRFLAAVSHDLRQPIHAMSLLAGVLNAAPETSTAAVRGLPGSVEIIRRMQIDLTAMGELVNRLLEVSRLQDGSTEVHLKPCRVSEILEAVASHAAQVANAKGLEFRVVESDASVLGDPVLLYSIVSNLTANAIRYTAVGGVLLACRRRGSAVRIEVWDTGIGIPSSEIDHIFQEYFRASNAPGQDPGRSGLGLGLSIVQGLAQLMNLKLIVRSRLGRGSVFAVEIPLLTTHSVGRSLPTGVDPHC